MMRYFLEDFIEESNACSTREQAFALYRKAIAQFGYNSAVYTFVTPHRDAGQPAGHGVQCDFPQDWMRYYSEQNYQPIDPVILRVKQTAHAFTWKQMVEREALTDRQRKILHEAQEAGLREGIGVPLHGPRGELAGTGLASTLSGVHPTPDILTKLQWLTQQFHLVYCSLGQGAVPAALPKLTEREIEILQWLAIGKTDQEIALILHCSAKTVRWHLENLYNKMEANSKILAVTKAIRQGLIALDLMDAG